MLTTDCILLLIAKHPLRIMKTGKKMKRSTDGKEV